MILRARQPGVPMRPPLHERAGGIDVEDAVRRIEEILWQDGLDHVRPQPRVDLFVVDPVMVLRAHDHGVDPLWTVPVVLHRDLRLSVRTQPGDEAGLPHLGKPMR